MARKNFETAWKSIEGFARVNGRIETLDRGNNNRIVSSSASEIVVISDESKKSEERHLTKANFKYAWDILESRRSIRLGDIDPMLRGKKSIIFAFLAKAPLRYSVKPLRLYLDP